MDGYLELGVCAFGFFPCVFNGFTGGCSTHTSLSAAIVSISISWLLPPNPGTAA